MKKSIIIVGPQGCGKSLNGKALAQAYRMPHWIEAETGVIPKYDHVILAHEVPRGTHGLTVVPFSEAIKKVSKPHPATPKIVYVCTTGYVDFLKPEAKGRRFWPVSAS